MAREFTPINLGIWNDDDFRELTPAAQHLYFVLLTEPSLSYCGTADWRPRKVAQRASGWLLGDLLDAALELADARLVLFADDTEEYLVRSFVRHDGVMSHPKLCVSAARATAAVGSNALRQVVVGEMRRLKDDRPDLPAWGRDEVAEVVKRKHLNGKEVDPFREPFSPGLREAVREAFSQNGSSRLESPYERPQNRTRTLRPSEQEPSGAEKSVPHQAPVKSATPQPCGRDHDVAQACGACADARRTAKESEAEALRARAASDRAAAQAAQARRRAEDESARAEADADPERVAEAKARALAAVKEAS